MTSFDTTLTPLRFAKPLLVTSSWFCSLFPATKLHLETYLACFLFCASSGITDRHSEMEGEQNRTSKIKTLHYKHKREKKNKITKKQGREEDTKGKAKLDEALILKCPLQPKPFYHSVKGVNIQQHRKTRQKCEDINTFRNLIPLK